MLTEQTASAFVEAFDELLDMYKEIGENIPLLMQYESLFKDPNFGHMRRVVDLLYMDVLKFHHAAYKYFKQRRKYREA